MTKQNNSVNFTGLERFTVDPSGANAAYTTIQEAIDAAQAAGGGVVCIAPGTYNQALTITGNVSLTAIASGASSGGSNVIINNGCNYDTTANQIEAEVSGIRFNGAGGNPGFSASGANNAILVATNCFFNGSSDTCISMAAPGQIRIYGAQIEAHSGVKTFDLTNGTIVIYNSQVNTQDTQATINSPGQNIFIFSSIVFDSYDVIDGQAIFFNCLCGTPSTLPIATVHTNGAAGFPGSLIINDSSASGYIIDGNGVGTSGAVFFFSFAQAPQVITPISFDPNLTVIALNELPFGTSGTSSSVIKGSVGFDNTQFSVSSGFVSLLSSPPGWVDTTAGTTIVVGTGYSVSSGAVVLILPATAAFGTRFAVSLSGGTSWQIAQGTGQSIRFGNQNTTVGAGGSITSVAQGDTLTLVCDVADIHWFVESSVGNVTVI